VRLWRHLDEVPRDWGRSVITIGVFDGVHRGHQRIVGRTVRLGRELGLPVVVVTFDPHPAEVVRPGTHPAWLTSPARRAELLFELGADAVFVLPFTLEVSRMGPDEFIQAVMVDRLHAAGVVVGENFRFGHRAGGDVALLRELGDKYDFRAEGVPLIENGAVISSTFVRERLAAGDVTAAARARGPAHPGGGVVLRVLETPPFTAIPADGVYAGWLQRLSGDQIDGPAAPTSRWPAAISIGTNPHFGDRDRSVEAYALDRDDLDLYGERVAVDFAARIRDMTGFASLEALIDEMNRDVRKAREITAGGA
jgi:riboflavin kinase/FMN adenylyltransferase